MYTYKCICDYICIYHFISVYIYMCVWVCLINYIRWLLPEAGCPARSLLESAGWDEFSWPRGCPGSEKRLCNHFLVGVSDCQLSSCLEVLPKLLWSPQKPPEFAVSFSSARCKTQASEASKATPRTKPFLNHVLHDHGIPWAKKLQEILHKHNGTPLGFHQSWCLMQSRIGASQGQGTGSDRE